MTEKCKMQEPCKVFRSRIHFYYSARCLRRKMEPQISFLYPLYTLGQEAREGERVSVTLVSQREETQSMNGL